MQRPPLSIRQDKEAIERYQELHEGIPEWMVFGVFQWAAQCLRYKSDLTAAEQYFRVRLDWSDIEQSGVEVGVVELLKKKRLDLLDHCLGAEDDPDYAEELEGILGRSGSAWTVGTDHELRWCLTRRVDETVLAAANVEMEQRSNAATHLRSAWHHAYGRNPDPSKAYSDAIKAVEAAACRVVIPNNPLPTLGLAVSAMRDKPEKWETVIGVDGDVDTVRMMMNTIWKGQDDRHGTDDPTRGPVEQPEAAAAVQIAVALVHLFRTGAIHSVS